MNSLFVLACALLVPGGVSAQTRGWEPSAGHTQCRYGRGQRRIWPGQGFVREFLFVYDEATRRFVNRLCPA